MNDVSKLIKGRQRRKQEDQIGGVDVAQVGNIEVGTKLMRGKELIVRFGAVFYRRAVTT
jgi:hypothetical protein